MPSARLNNPLNLNLNDPKMSVNVNRKDNDGVNGGYNVRNKKRAIGIMDTNVYKWLIMTIPTSLYLSSF